MTTALLCILDKDNKPIQCRGLLNTCSTTNFITERLADVLRLKRKTCHISVGALNTLTTYSKGMITATIKSRVNNYEKVLTFLIVPTISPGVPNQPINRSIINIPANVTLADSIFHQPAPVDVLLGTGTTLSSLSIGQLRLNLPENQELFLQKTLLGWIIGGAAPLTEQSNKRRTCHVTSLEFNLSKLMGNLPQARVNQTQPFNHVGVDYCSPFILKEKKFRNKSSIKAYIALFVCMTVKAVHLKLVTDLTTECFIAALRRFISRRVMCQHIYSDNTRNFTGAFNTLKELNNILNDPKNQEAIQGYLTTKNIQWHFNPPQAPHVGGLWEAAVKSLKKHLKCVAGRDSLFTYEEFNTLIVEIEAILNSRPLTPLSSDPNDPIVLTPGHFLIGDSLTNLHGRDHSATPTNLLSTWEHIQKVKQHFWKRWSREYLNELTIRTKWVTDNPNIQKGAIVLLRDDNLPPTQWALGRIIECFPGSDGVIRTVSVKTATTTFIRNIKKLAILPVEV